MPAISEGYSRQEQERKRKFYNKYIYVCVFVVQFYPWFKFHFHLFWGIGMYDNEFETKEFET